MADAVMNTNTNICVKQVGKSSRNCRVLIYDKFPLYTHAHTRVNGARRKSKSGTLNISMFSIFMYRVFANLLRDL